MNLAGGNQELIDLWNQYGAIGIAAAPMTTSLLARMIMGKSRVVTMAVRLSGGWAAARLFLTPHVDQMKETLVALTALIHNNGFN